MSMLLSTHEHIYHTWYMCSLVLMSTHEHMYHAWYMLMSMILQKPHVPWGTMHTHAYACAYACVMHMHPRVHMRMHMRTHEYAYVPWLHAVFAKTHAHEHMYHAWYMCW